MVKINIDSDLATLAGKLNSLASKQIPRAIAFALTDIGAAVVKAEVQTAKQVFHNPTPFIVKEPRKSGGSQAFRLSFANPKKLESSVTIQPKQSQSLHWQIEGGSKTPTKQALVVPAAARLNKYGNLSRTAVSRFLTKSSGTGSGSTFSGIPKGTKFKDKPGIYQRMGPGGRKKLKPLVYWKPRATYQPRFKFYEVGRVIVRDHFTKELNKQMLKAFAAAQKAR